MSLPIRRVLMAVAVAAAVTSMSRGQAPGTCSCGADPPGPPAGKAPHAEPFALKTLRNRGRHKIFLGYAPGVGKPFTMLAEAQRRFKRGRRDVDLLRKSDRELTVAREQPLGVDDRQADDLAGVIKTQHVTLGRVLTVGRRLALADVEVQHVAHLVIGGVIESEMSDANVHGFHPGGSLRLP